MPRSNCPVRGLPVRGLPTGLFNCSVVSPCFRSYGVELFSKSGFCGSIFGAVFVPTAYCLRTAFGPIYSHCLPLWRRRPRRLAIACLWVYLTASKPTVLDCSQLVHLLARNVKRPVIWPVKCSICSYSGLPSYCFRLAGGIKSTALKSTVLKSVAPGPNLVRTAYSLQLSMPRGPQA